MKKLNTKTVRDQKGRLYCSPCSLETEDSDIYLSYFDISESDRDAWLKKLYNMESFKNVKKIDHVILYKEGMKDFIKQYRTKNENAANIQDILSNPHAILSAVFPNDGAFKESMIKLAK